MDDFRRLNDAGRLQLGPESLAEIRHGSKIINATLVDPLDQLRGAEWLLVLLDTEGLHGLRVEPEQVDLGVGTSGSGRRVHSAGRSRQFPERPFPDRQSRERHFRQC